MSACFPGLVTYLGIGRGFIAPDPHGTAQSAFRLPSDPVGTTSVTFTGVMAGSEIRIYLSDMTELAGVESCDTDHVLTWNVYASGSPNNTVRVKIINTAYKIKDFPYTAQLGNQNIPVQMELDQWYSNP